MGREFQEQRGIPVVAVGMVILIAGLVGGPVLIHWLGVRANMAAARDWTPPGVPCLEVSAADFAAHPMSHSYVVRYGSMILTRAASPLECTDIAYRGGRGPGEFPVCRMMSPNLLQVRVGGRDHYFIPGFGRAVTVSLPHGQLVCQVGPNDTLERDPREPF